MSNPERTVKTDSRSPDLGGPLPGSEFEAPPPAESFLQAGRRRFFSNKAGVASVAILLILIILAVAAPIFTSYDPNRGVAADRLLGIGSPGHLLGTDELGRDMLTRLLYGGRPSLVAGIVPVVAATLVGTVLGTIAGFSTAWANVLIMRTMDMLYGFPSIMIAIAIATALGPGLRNIIIALTVAYIPPITRMVEQETRRIANREFILAARVAGAGRPTIIRTQVLGNIFTP